MCRAKLKPGSETAYPPRNRRARRGREAGDPAYGGKPVKVGIIGAGIAGLCCALALERYGIVPDVFDWSDHWDRGPFTACLLELFGRPVPDQLIDLRKRYGISLEPIHTLNRLVMFSPRNMDQVQGWLGYVFARGDHPRSIERQLAATLARTRIRFNTAADYRELSTVYDHVVVATGSTRFPLETGCWTDIFRAWVRGAVVEGNFEPTAWFSWFDKSYANNGYAYLGPFNNREASLALVVSDIEQSELEARWQMFLKKEKLDYPLKRSFIMEHIAGVCYPKAVGNVTFIGNAGGFMDSMLGFGVYNSIVSGVLAAEAIHEGSSFPVKVSFLRKRLRDAYLIRRCLNKFTNHDYDRLMGVLKLPPVNRLVYNSSLDIISLLSAVLERIDGSPQLFNKF